MSKLYSMLILLLAFAATLVNASAVVSPGCNKWRHRSDIQGTGHMKTMTSRDSSWCKKECMKLPECVAVTYQWHGRKCSLYRATADAVIGDSKIKHTFVFCPRCDNRTLRNQKVEGGEQLMAPFPIKDMHWCRKKCMQTEGCNAFNWNGHGKRLCELLTAGKPSPALPGPDGVFTRKSVSGSWSGILCNTFSLLPVCGGKGEPICYNGGNCDDGLSITRENTCECGGEYETCCEGALAKDGPCDAGFNCKGNDTHKQCEPCGGEWEQCCADDKCDSDDGQRRTCGGNPHYKQCRPCGGMWQDVCPGPKKCDHGFMPDMHGGTQCVMMGTD